jgi:hypothetical protein
MHLMMSYLCACLYHNYVIWELEVYVAYIIMGDEENVVCCIHCLVSLRGSHSALCQHFIYYDPQALQCNMSVVCLILRTVWQHSIQSPFLLTNSKWWKAWMRRSCKHLYLIKPFLISVLCHILKNFYTQVDQRHWLRKNQGFEALSFACSPSSVHKDTISLTQSSWTLSIFNWIRSTTDNPIQNRI